MFQNATTGSSVTMTLPKNRAAELIGTTSLRLDRIEKDGAIISVPGYDALGQPRASYLTTGLLEIKPCLETTDRLLANGGTAEAIDGHIWALAIQYTPDGKRQYVKRDLGKDENGTICKKIYSIPGALAFAESKIPGFPKTRLRSHVKDGTLPAILIDGITGPVITDLSLASYLRNQTPGKVDRNRFKMATEIYDLVLQRQPKLCGKDGKLNPMAKLEVSECLRVWSNSTDGKTPKVPHAEARIEREAVVAAGFAGCNGKLLPFGQKKMKQCPLRKLYDWSAFVKHWTAPLTEHAKKVARLHREGRSRAEIDRAMETDGIVGIRLRRVRDLAKVTKSRKHQPRGAAKNWLERNLKNGPVLFNILKRDGKKYVPALRLARIKLECRVDRFSFAVVNAPKHMPPKRFAFWRLPTHQPLTHEQMKQAVEDYLANDVKAKTKGGVESSPTARNRETDINSGKAEPSNHANELLKVIKVGKKFFICGKEKPLRKAQYDCIDALFTTTAQGLHKNDLVLKSGRSDARGILTRLKKSDPDWDAVIDFPEVIGAGGYRLKR